MYSPDYSKFFEKNSSLLCITGYNGVFFTVNGTVCHTLGYEADEFMSKSFSEFILPEELEKTDKIFKNLASQKIPVEAELTLCCKDGSQKIVLWNIAPDAESGQLYFSGIDVTKRRQLRTLLDESQKIAKVGGWELDLKTRSYFLTKEVYNIFELPDTTGFKLGDGLDYFLDEDKTAIQDALKGAIEHRKEYDLELKFITAKGNNKWVRCKGSPVVESNTVTKLIGTFQDITTRKENEIRLADKEARLKAITDFSPIGIFVTDPNGSCTYINKAYESITGLSSDEALGQGWIKALYSDDREKTLENWQRATSNGEHLALQMRFCKSEGKELVWTSAQAAPFFHDGKVLGYVGLVEDITEKHKSEQRVKESEQRLRDAQRVSNLGSWEYNFATEELVWSEETFMQLGLNPQNGVPTQDEYLKLIHPEDVHILLENVTNTIKTGEAYEIELRVIAQNGEIRYSRMKGVPIYEDAKMVKLVGTSSDITAQKIIEMELVAAKEKAEEASQAKAQFLSTMSHEIRTPLNAVIGMTHLLLQEDPKPEQLENLRTLKFSSENLLALINDILDFSKIEAGKISFEHIDFNLAETINGIKFSLAPLAEEKGIKLRFCRDEDLPRAVVGDPVRLSQILINLVSNAIKFTNEGTVTVDAIVTAETTKTVAIEFSVEDTGIGIAKDRLEQIFEAFTQESANTTRRFGGTGLGLTITRRLLDLQNSRIEVESTPGKGSRFYFTLIFGKSDAAFQQAPVYTTDVQTFKSLRGLKVLLAEDNKINQLVATKFLHKWDIEVDIAENGTQAIQKSAQNRYDIIFMDLQMPETDGYEATKAIRASGNTDIIIALTASATTDVREKVIQLGMDDYITKPFNPKELYNKIVKYLPVDKQL